MFKIIKRKLEGEKNQRGSLIGGGEATEAPRMRSDTLLRWRLR